MCHTFPSQTLHKHTQNGRVEEKNLFIVHLNGESFFHRLDPIYIIRVNKFCETRDKNSQFVIHLFLAIVFNSDFVFAYLPVFVPDPQFFFDFFYLFFFQISQVSFFFYCDHEKQLYIHNVCV